MNTIIKTSTITLLCFAMTSCSLFSSSKQLVTIETTNPNATIKANGAIIGKGQVTTPLRKGKSHAITADYGTQHGMAMLSSELSLTGKLDIVGTFFFLFPVLGLLSDGAWTLDPDYVRIDLQ